MEPINSPTIIHISSPNQLNQFITSVATNQNSSPNENNPIISTFRYKSNQKNTSNLNDHIHQPSSSLQPTIIPTTAQPTNSKQAKYVEPTLETLFPCQSLKFHQFIQNDLQQQQMQLQEQQQKQQQQQQQQPLNFNNVKQFKTVPRKNSLTKKVQHPPKRNSFNSVFNQLNSLSKSSPNLSIGNHRGNVQSSSSSLPSSSSSIPMVANNMSYSHPTTNSSSFLNGFSTSPSINYNSPGTYGPSPMNDPINQLLFDNNNNNNNSSSFEMNNNINGQGQNPLFMSFHVPQYQFHYQQQQQFN
ncbi:hypothetical protein DFA_08799 [Cavenderia fasciculata]|uniref:Uncharacterized protein n=1 Tax=Cavenderia fasciculata TaxID=261658 RepID=F4Q4F0_CACFS|nr:uncharacterized protein DFA_08799 [Cavenderia fasciculata]EGG17799.1 hypothetical protein DFA_08799 [Cavenderia fasciculata]|eukprot:XP_004356283.1 hypothetical protein DFA_08799 [Cavenderia fasciculata]